MGFLDYELAGNSVARWLAAVAILVLGTLLLGLVKRQLARRLGALAERTSGRLDDTLVRLVERTHTIVLFLVAVAAATLLLALPRRWSDAIGAVVVVALIVQGGFWAVDLLLYAIRGRLARRDQAGQPIEPDPGTWALFRVVTRLLVWSVVLLLCLDNLGVDITALVTGLGIGGLAVALAVQNILGDLFASVSIVLDKPFVVGDFIVLGDFMGTVETIGIKTTRLRSLSGEQLVVSNADLLQSRIRNFQRMQERRVEFRIGVLYTTPPPLLRAIPGWLRQIVEAQPETRFDRAHLKALGDTVQYEVVYFVPTPDMNRFMDTQEAINLAICERFAEEGVEFWYPGRPIVLPPREPPDPKAALA